ncbi:CAD5123935.1DgyrCDS12244 [Octopus vulgaris]|uniref:CAD5123935.1DgyrCDS12244 n=1 Tax=Octopus vulgaris TaxID=6645 RepID=A0AA36FDI4_OCTVU|nr:CAD5123935.1DgyrCDS12244 [Octopus vulgaris]
MSVLLRNSVRQSLLMAQKHAAPKASLISGPPRVKISKVEKFSLGALMVTLVCTPSGIILANLKNYTKSG